MKIKKHFNRSVVRSSRGVMVAWVMCALLACVDGAEKKSTDAAAEEVPEGLQLTKMHARIYNDDALETTVQSDKAILELEKKELHLDNVAVDFQQDGKSSNKVYSQSGLLYLSDRQDEGIGRNDLELSGGVKIESSSGMRVKAPRLRYFQKEGKLETGGGSYEQTIQNEGSVLKITGTKLEANRDLTKIVHHGAKISQSSE